MLAADAACINKANVRTNIFAYAYKIASTVHAHKVTFFLYVYKELFSFVLYTANPLHSVKQQKQINCELYRVHSDRIAW